MTNDPQLPAEIRPGREFVYELGLVIYEWSRLENILKLFAAHLVVDIKESPKSYTAAFMVFNGMPCRAMLGIMEAIAGQYYSDHAAEFTTLRERIDKKAKKRHSLAHNLWIPTDKENQFKILRMQSSWKVKILQDTTTIKELRQLAFELNCLGGEVLQFASKLGFSRIVTKDPSGPPRR